MCHTPPHTCRAPLAALMALTLCVTAACSDPEPTKKTVTISGISDPSLITFLKDTYGLTLTGLEETAEFELAPNGDLLVEDEFTISVDGLGSRELYMYEEIYSAAEGGGVLLLLEDTATGDYRYFEYNPSDNYLRFSQTAAGDPRTFPERGATVQGNADGSYTVWTFDDSKSFDRENEQRAANGYEAMKLVEQYNDFASITPHIMLAAFAFGNTHVPEPRSTADCGNTEAAARPPVCTLFKEFCECVACSTLGRTAETCAQCPKLQ